MNYHVELIDMSVTIKGLAVPNEDNSYTIIINSKLNYEQQKQAFIHEIKHLLNCDFEKENVDVIEYYTNGVIK